jgi:hypothetical protein
VGINDRGFGLLGETLAIVAIAADKNFHGEHDALAAPLVRIFVQAGGYGTQRFHTFALSLGVMRAFLQQKWEQLGNQRDGEKKD